MTMPRIRSLLEGRLSTWAAARSPALAVAWENAAFTPPAGTYLRAFILPSATRSDDLEGSHRQYTGVFQVSIVAPLGTGPGAAEGIAEELATLFPVVTATGGRYTNSGFVVSIITPMANGPFIREPDRNVLPVSCRYRADTI